MHVVQPRESLAVAIEKGRHAIRLEAGVRYVMHDVETVSGRDAGVFASVEPPPDSPVPLDRGAAPKRVVIPFIGGLGDAISLLPVLRAIKARPARPRIEIATTPGPAQVFTLCPHVDAVVPHPLTEDDWRRYDAFASLEAVHQTGQEPGRPLPEIFAAALGLDPPEPVFDLTIPAPSHETPRPTGGPPIVAIAAGEGDALRAYPHVHTIELVERLASSGVACILLGHADPMRRIREHPPLVTDMRGRTPSVLELATWLREMDVVIAIDSLIMHLAGALGRPTVSLFAPTTAAHAAPYAGATALTSAAACAPCHASGTTCPQGYDHCRAWDVATVAPTAVAEAVFAALARAGRHSHFLENVRTSPPAV